MNKNRWLIAVIALIAVSVLGIGGVVFYGTVQLPKDRLAQDSSACTTFAAGVASARNKVMEAAQKNTAITDPELAQIYLDEVDKGIDAAFQQAASKGEVSNALAQLGLSRISYDATQGFQAVTALEQAYQPVTDACTPVLTSASPVATPSS